MGRGREFSLMLRISSVLCLAYSHTNERDRRRGRKWQKRNLVSMRHTKVHPLRSKRRDAQSRLTGLCRYRMPLSHVFVLRRFEDTRESNYGHPSFALASIFRTLLECPVRTIHTDSVVFRSHLCVFLRTSSHLAANGLE